MLFLLELGQDLDNEPLRTCDNRGNLAIHYAMHWVANNSEFPTPSDRRRPTIDATGEGDDDDGDPAVHDAMEFVIQYIVDPFPMSIRRMVRNLSNHVFSMCVKSVTRHASALRFPPTPTPTTKEKRTRKSTENCGRAKRGPGLRMTVEGIGQGRKP